MTMSTNTADLTHAAASAARAASFWRADRKRQKLLPDGRRLAQNRTPSPWQWL